jgi:MoxR-like ATPase
LVYVYFHPDIELAINVALATRRPLLLSGPSGCGKSCLARNVALTLGRRYYEFVVTARSEARDLLWGFDALHRLNDAQARTRKLKPDQSYVEPGRLWWALDPESASWRGTERGIPAEERANDPSEMPGDNAVLLIDEIDKADPDFPNNLLVPLGSFQFFVESARYLVNGQRTPLVLITTNRERELPRAFLRRCVTLEIPALGIPELVEVAIAVLSQGDRDEGLFHKVAERVTALKKESREGVSTAEFLDTVRACLSLKIDPESEDFQRLSKVTLEKDFGRGRS